jgi:2-dehydro-3-deoxy-D-pentonate aldolase
MSLPSEREALESHSALPDAQFERPMRGVIVPLVTPLLSRDTLDVEGLNRLLMHVLDGGVNGIFLLGTTGESAALSGRLRRELLVRVCRGVEGRVPVVVAVSDTCLVESLRLAEDAALAGAAAVVVTAPYYLPLDNQELVGYVHEVASESPLPLYLYNIPELAKSCFSTKVLTELLDVEKVVGFKDSSGDFEYFKQVRALAVRRPDWSLLMGSEILTVDAIRAGAHGCVAGGANIFPRLFVSLYEASLTNDKERTATLQQVVRELSQLYRFGKYAVGSIRGIKCALSVMGLTKDRMADPFASADSAQREAIQSQLRQIDSRLSARHA